MKRLLDHSQRVVDDRLRVSTRRMSSLRRLEGSWLMTFAAQEGFTLESISEAWAAHAPHPADCDAQFGDEPLPDNRLLSIIESDDEADCIGLPAYAPHPDMGELEHPHQWRRPQTK